MKTLYQILLTEALGLLRKEYDYSDLASFLAEYISENFEQLYHQHDKQIFENDQLKSTYPEWIESLLVVIKNSNKDDIGSFDVSSSKLVNGRLNFRITLNMIAVRKKSSNNYNSKLSKVIMKRLLESTIHHELKHAFDDWIHKSKNIINKIEEKYFIDKEALHYMNMDAYWKNFFKTAHYLQSKFERTANQQELLTFYKNTSFGRLFIQTLKIKYPTPAQFIDYISNMHISQYTAFYYNIAEEMNQVIKDSLENMEIVSIIQNPYIDFIWLIQNTITIANRTDEHTCRHLIEKISNIDFHGVKIPKNGTYKERLIKTLEKIKYFSIKYLQNNIINRAYKFA